MNIFSFLFGKNTQKQFYVSFLGPSNSGKTTLAKFVETGKVVEDDPHTTMGVDIRKKPKQIDNLLLKIIDTGGQVLYQNYFWEIAVENSSGIVILIDATIHPDKDYETFTAIKKQVFYALEIIPIDQPILILLNKQDRIADNPLTTEQAIEFYELREIIDQTKSVKVSEISAKFGDGVIEAFQWLADQLKNQPSKIVN